MAYLPGGYNQESIKNGFAKKALTPTCIRWLLTSLSLLLILSGTATVQAAKPPVGLKITPLRNYPSLNPGATSDSSITLTNLTGKAQTVSLSSELFGVTDEEYDYDFTPSSITQWIQFADTQIRLGINQKQTVPYGVAIPANATPGDHFFVLLASLNPSISSNHINEISRVASLIYLQVNGNLSKQSRLLSASVPWLSGSSSIPLTAQVADSGNTYIRARIGVYAARQPFGQTESLAQLDNVILPSTVRKVSAMVLLPNVPGLYKISALYASPSGTPMTLNHYVLYLPAWLRLVLFVGVVGSGFIFWRRLHRPVSPK